MSTASENNPLDALIIGAGFAGICLGKRLLDAGISNFRMRLRTA